MLGPAIKFDSVTSFRLDTLEKFSIASRSCFTPRRSSRLIADAGLSSLESPERKSRHEVHFLVGHCRSRRGEKRTKGVAGRERDGLSRAPGGWVFRRRGDFRADEARHKKFALRSGSTEIWISGKVDVRGVRVAP